MSYLLKKHILLIWLMLLTFLVNAQVTKIMGTVIDATTKDPVPFVNIYFSGTDVATTTDFDGKFAIESKIAKDTLFAQYMGYNKQGKAVLKNKFQMIDFELKPIAFELTPVEILAGENPAEIILKKVIKNKELNNREFYDAFQYEAYNKVQVDANNYTEKFTNNIFLRPFRFVFENADTSTINGKVYLPVFFTETLSNIYFRKQPLTYREIITASKASGMDKSNISELVGDSYQKVNIYDNYHQLFEKNFVSPVANFGLSYYKYYLIDSVIIDGRKCYHLKFKPRRSQELTYTGNIWIHDSTFGVVKVDMKVVKDANINIINEILIQQDFILIDNKYWLPSNDKLIADLNITENSSKIIGIYIHKTTSYKNFSVNNILPEKFYREPQSIVVKDSALTRNEKYWDQYRHDSLSRQELNIYKMVDTVRSLRAYRIYSDILFAVSTNHIRLGYFEFGPLLSVYSYNRVEGQRFKLGLRTSNKFSKKCMITTYAAYGYLDDEFKYGASIRYLIKKNPNTGFRLSYSKEIEQLGLSVNALASDMIFRSFVGRNPMTKLSMSKTFQLGIEKEWFIGLSNNLLFVNRVIYPLSSSKEPFFILTENEAEDKKSSLVISEVQFHARFAFNEKYLSGEFQRLSLGTKYPVVGLSYIYGFKNLFKSDFEYHKLEVNLTHWFNIGTIGWSKYIITGGKIWGRLPYPLLKIHEGNETYIFDQMAFNTMNYYEFISDQYLSLSYTHHFDGLLFNRIPLLKKLRWREVIHYKGLIGSLSDKNRFFSRFPDNSYELTGLYNEVGVGIENIFKVIRIDGVWRLNYHNHKDIRKFMLMISLNFNF